MTAREELHLAVEAIEYIADLKTGLPNETLEAIREGVQDIRQGRMLTVEVYRRTRSF